jgi:endonuclease G
MKRLLAFLLTTLLVSTSAFAIRPALPVAQCAAQAPYSTPYSGHLDITLVCHEGYLLEHDNQAKIPNWVSYVLTPRHAVGCFPRVSRFVPEPSLRPGASALGKDYAASGYDIGHMANDDDMRWSAATEQESNIFANAAPQLPGLNRAGWLRLEELTRTWAIGRQHPLLVYVGPIYDQKGAKTIGPDRVVIPKAFYKVLVDTVTKEVVAFIYPQAETKERPGAFLSSLAEVQKQAGFVLPMPKGATFSTTLWPATASVRKEKNAVCAIN